jgi:hypothetical protein
MAIDVATTPSAKPIERSDNLEMIRIIDYKCGVLRSIMEKERNNAIALMSNHDINICENQHKCHILSQNDLSILLECHPLIVHALNIFR